MGSGEWGVGLRPTAYFLIPRHGVRHIIAVRDEARPHAGADGRDAHPYLARMGFAGGLGLAVGGLMWRHQVQSIQHSMQHSVLCARHLSGRADRPRSAEGPEGEGIREWGVGLRPTAYFLRPRHGVRHIIAVRDEARPHAGADQRGRWSLPRSGKALEGIGPENYWK